MNFLKWTWHKFWAEWHAERWLTSDDRTSEAALRHFDKAAQHCFKARAIERDGES
jgi:hypothetical protein